jgi:hypothetical protein
MDEKRLNGKHGLEPCVYCPHVEGHVIWNTPGFEDNLIIILWRTYSMLNVRVLSAYGRSTKGATISWPNKVNKIDNCKLDDDYPLMEETSNRPMLSLRVATPQSTWHHRLRRRWHRGGGGKLKRGTREGSCKEYGEPRCTP